jgi:hypothetical protein
LGLIISNLKLAAQEQEFIQHLPDNFKKGIVIYQYSDSSFFVFKAKDYLISMELELDDIDSIYRPDYISLTDTLKYAMDHQFIIVENIYATVNSGRDRIFPNSFILMNLFSSNRIIVFKGDLNRYKKINYYHKKKRGTYYVIQKGSSAIYFISGYKIIEH